MPADKDPIYPISVAARILDVHPRTIRIYEEEGLLKPARKGNKRFFSNDDIEWIKCIRQLIHDQGISIPGIKRLLQLVPCWKIKDCPDDVRSRCSAFIDHAVPCWQMTGTACQVEMRQCKECRVYLDAMASLNS